MVPALGRRRAGLLCCVFPVVHVQVPGHPELHRIFRYDQGHPGGVSGHPSQRAHLGLCQMAQDAQGDPPAAGLKAGFLTIPHASFVTSGNR